MRPSLGSTPFVVAAVVACTVSALPQPAHACSCAIAAAFSTVPRDGAADIPRDTLLWVAERVLWEEPYSSVMASGGGAQVVTLVSDDGGEVALEPHASMNAPGADDEFARALLIGLFVSDGPLSPQTRFEIRVDDVTVASFTTGEGLAPAPTPPTLQAGSGSASFDALPGVPTLSTCGATYTRWFSAPHDGAFVVPGVGTDPELPSTDHLATATTLLPQDAFFVGRSACAGRTAGSYLTGDTVRAASVSYSGVISTWSEPTAVVFPLPGCACVASPSGVPLSSASLGVLAGLAGLVALTRRRRPRRHQAVRALQR